MRQANSEHNPSPANTLGSSFAAAWTGLRDATKTQRNLRIHLMCALAAAAAGGFLRVSPMEWCILVLTVAAVLCLELLNTALEAAVDLMSPATHPLARTAKDTAAASVLVMAGASVVIGVVLFVPRLLPFLGW